MQGRVGGFFWDLVRGWMGSEIILSISRLTDSPEMGKHRNLTLAALLDDPRLSGQLRCELRCELQHIQKLKLVKEVRERRNRVVAHSDERIALGEDALPILQPALESGGRAERPEAQPLGVEVADLIIERYGEDARGRSV